MNIIKIIINDYVICYKCNLQMKFVNNNSFIHKVYWLCYNRAGNNKHNVKINIRAHTFLEDIKSDNRIIYFILFENFIFIIKSSIFILQRISQNK